MKDHYPNPIPVAAGAFEKIDGGLRVLGVDVLNPFMVMMIGYQNCLIWCNYSGNPTRSTGSKTRRGRRATCWSSRKTATTTCVA